METVKAHKGMGMNGVIARWYAGTTRSALPEFRALAERVAQMAPGPDVLEVAPGPGYFAIELAKFGKHRVTALDISETFVQIGRKNAADAGVQVDFQRGNAAAMPIAGNAFDFIVCRAAFKNFAEPLRALQEMRRVLKPGGQGLVIDLRRDVSISDIDRELDRYSPNPANRLFMKLTFRFMLIRRAYTRTEMEQLTARAGFSVTQLTETPIGFEILMTKER
jgi:ubiquinone/menaquinone biosynthesis C-methylase UbiE